MKYLCCFLLCIVGCIQGAWADFQPPNPYVGALGFEVFADRIQQVHMWRRTQELMQEVALTNEVLLRLGWSGLPEAGNNYTMRLAVKIKTDGRPDVKLLLDGDEEQYDEKRSSLSLEELETLTFNPNYQIKAADTEQGRGVCYDISKKKCFEEDTRKIQGIFGEFYGSGGRFDQELKELLKADNLKNFHGESIDQGEEMTHEFEPFMPVSAQFYQTGKKSLQTWQKEIVDNLQIKRAGERDQQITELNNKRRKYKQNAGIQGLATVFKNTMNLSPVDVSQTIFKKMLNTAFGIRGLIQLNSHMALYQQGLIDNLIANRSLGSLRVTGTSLAAKTSAKGEESTDSDSAEAQSVLLQELESFLQDLKDNSDGMLWGTVR